VQLPAAAAAEGRRVVIERAGSAEYFEVEEGADGLVRLSGGVSLLVSDTAKAESHRLSAREILYDRERNSVTARGAVRYRREAAGSFEEFAGEILEADLDDWSGIFVDGTLLRSGGGSGAAGAAAAGGAAKRAFSFSGDSIKRRAGDLILLDRAVVTSCDEADPHYSLHASRMWLLGPGEWAIADAVLRLGRVPVLWIPFFYYPSEEILFHPVIGYRAREGRFVQTTTYLVGRKPESTSTGFLSSLTGTTDKADGAREIKGIFLRSVPGPAPANESAFSQLKVMLDFYSGLGAFAGLDGKLQAAKPVERLEFQAGLGLSRSIFGNATTGYTPFVADEDWKSDWNSANFLGLELPLRFGLSLSGSLGFGKLKLSGDLPLYSDPWWDRDFRDRSEDMDWLGFSEKAAQTSPGKRSSFSQKLGLTYSWAPQSLKPLLASVDVSRLQASLTWLSKVGQKPAGQSAASFAADPTKEFFYPDVVRPLDLAMSLRGSLLSSASGKPAASSGGKAAAAGDIPLRSPWREEKSEEESSPPSEAAEKGGTAASKGKLGLEPAFRGLQAAPPWTAPAAASASKASWSLDWTLAPNLFFEDSFKNNKSSEWQKPEDIDLAERFYSLRFWKVAAGLSGSLSLAGMQGNLGLTWSQQAQESEFTADTAYVSDVANQRLADYKATSSKLGGTLKLSAKPLAAIPSLSGSSLSWSMDAALFGRSFDRLDAGTPLWKLQSPGWDKETITRHEAGASLALVLDGQSQQLGLTFALPPLAERYGANLALAAALAAVDVKLQANLKMSRPDAASDFAFDPLAASLNLGAPGGFSLGDSLSWDLENGRPISNQAKLSWGDASLSFTARRAIPQEPLLGVGWKQAGEESFLPQSFDASWKKSLKAEGSAMPASLALTSSYSQSLIRFTESTLSFGLSGNLKIGSGIALTMASSSQNKAAWRYWPGLFPQVDLIGGSEAWKVSILEDLANSFAFGDDARRTKSRFKLKSLSFGLTQDLHDWNLKVGVVSAPLYDSATKTYAIDTKITIDIAWKDIPPLKASLTRAQDAWTY
jgi:hypothetical protein